MGGGDSFLSNDGTYKIPPSAYLDLSIFATDIGTLSAEDTQKVQDAYDNKTTMFLMQGMYIFSGMMVKYEDEILISIPSLSSQGDELSVQNLLYNLRLSDNSYKASMVTLYFQIGGYGTKFLTDDGTYKPIPSSSLPVLDMGAMFPTRPASGGYALSAEYASQLKAAYDAGGRFVAKDNDGDSDIYYMGNISYDGANMMYRVTWGQYYINPSGTGSDSAIIGVRAYQANVMSLQSGQSTTYIMYTGGVNYSLSIENGMLQISSYNTYTSDGTQQVSARGQMARVTMSGASCQVDVTGMGGGNYNQYPLLLYLANTGSSSCATTIKRGSLSDVTVDIPQGETVLFKIYHGYLMERAYLI